MGNCNTFGKPWSSASTPGGPYKRFKINISTVTGRMIVQNSNNPERNPAQDTHRPSDSIEGRVPQRKTQHWPHSHSIHSRTGGKLSKIYMQSMESRHILRGTGP